MPSVFLDANIYDLLHADDAALSRLSTLVASKLVEVIVTPKLIDELSRSPFNGVPQWFETKFQPEAVTVVGHAFLGQSFLSEGTTYEAHKGDSKQVADAIHAESATAFADFFVSEDNRARRRLSALETACRCLTYSEFCSDLLNLESAG